MFKIKNGYYEIMYTVFSRQIMVFNIQPISSLQKARDSLERASVYHVKKDQNGIWRAKDKGATAHVSTRHAAVNGQSNNITKAAWLMGEHLKVAYGELSEYTLFHNPSVGGPGDTWESVQDKFGFTTDITKAFANTLESAQSKDSDTFWVAHSQGGLIFSEAVRYLLNDKSSFSLNKLRLNGLNRSDKGQLLDKQSVAFHGNANNNIRSRNLFERAGVKVNAIRKHDYDFVTNIIGMNTINPRKLVGSLVYSNHVISGSLTQSPHTTIQSQKEWEDNMISGPGKGRNGIQKAFHKVGTTKTYVAKRIQNYLK